MTSPMPTRGKSRQDYSTPRAFIDAVEREFGPINHDLAATDENAKAPRYYTPTDNSLVQPWHGLVGNLWLNPEFSDISPWAEKCAECIGRYEAQRRILLLTPASIGANWFRDHVHGRAWVLGLNGRLTFDGERMPYPKDLMLSVFGAPPGFDVWDWRHDPLPGGARAWTWRSS